MSYGADGPAEKLQFAHLLTRSLAPTGVGVMICPLCLNKIFRFKRIKNEGRLSYQCARSGCRGIVPRMFVEDYRIYPPVVVSAVGFSGHGKTTFLASLFNIMEKIAGILPRFSTLALDEESLDIVNQNREMLIQGELPESTPKNFPRPTIVRAGVIPKYGKKHLLFYDASGEAFERPTEMVQYASFVKHSETVMFLVSLKDLEEPKTEMHNLLQVYIQGIRKLGGYPQKQHLVIVYTKADELRERFVPDNSPVRKLNLRGQAGGALRKLKKRPMNRDWGDVWEYLVSDNLEDTANLRKYISQMNRISKRLREFTEYELGVHNFLNLSKESFKSCEFSIISALGAKPVGSQLQVSATPRRVIDPLLWMVEKSTPPLWKRILIG